MSMSDESITCPFDYSEALDFDPELAEGPASYKAITPSAAASRGSRSSGCPGAAAALSFRLASDRLGMWARLGERL
ncbi:hypothetical protein [Streptomyces mirabilis]|uniref:hypothetical protein n=1 Tax=Streptomyces mirabilis TaxID=68239 RepID=UPI003691C570